MNIAVIGYRWAGKTTVSRELQARTGWARVESDRLVEERLGMRVAEVVRCFGWSGFRAAERSVITAELRRDRIILDLGGGAVTDPTVTALLRRAAFVVFLDCPPHLLAERSATSYARPRLTALAPLEELRLKLEERLPLYRSCADLVVDASLTPSQCAVAILESMPVCRRDLVKEASR